MFYQNTWKDQLTKIEYYVNGSLSYFQTLTYDASGNVTNLVDSRTSYAYKNYEWEGRQLIEYLAYSNALSFKYNDQGIRTQKVQVTPSGTTTTDYILDGDRVLVESRSNGITLCFTYDVDGSLLSVNYNGNEYFYITNRQGDVIELVDVNGQSAVKYNDDAWGNMIYKSGGSLADINPYRYRGYRFDVETGLYYLQSRYYDPAIGRFISGDGLLGETGNLLTHNMYAYCANNPVMHIDPTGDAFLGVLSTLLTGALIGGVVGILSAAINGDDLLAGLLSGALSGAISTVGIAFAVATGGLVGLAISGVSGFLAGGSSSILNQGMTTGWDKIDYEKARNVGLITSIASSASFGLISFIANNSVGAYEKIIDKSLSLGTRIGHAMNISAESFMTAMFVDLPITTVSSLGILLSNRKSTRNIRYDVTIRER